MLVANQHGFNHISFEVPDIEGGTSIAVAGDTVICGGENRISTADRKTKKLTWTTKIEGEPLSLAVANGRLYVSTDKGSLYCFAKDEKQPAIVRDRKLETKQDSPAASWADEIVRQGGVTEGFCADLGCGDGELTLALTQRSKLQIYAIDADPEKVAQARKKLEAAGLYGKRVTVHLGDPAHSEYPRYFANLVVSGRSISEPPSKNLQTEIARVQRPFGGVALIGKGDTLTKNIRGPLEGAGSWTHQYADASNTCCSTDNLVQGPLGMLWFRDSDLEGPSRHGRGPAPLFLEGRLFAEGTNGIRAVDASSTCSPAAPARSPACATVPSPPRCAGPTTRRPGRSGCASTPAASSRRPCGRGAGPSWASPGSGPRRWSSTAPQASRSAPASRSWRRVRGR